MGVVHTEEGKKRLMIELILFVGVLLVILTVWILCGRVDNTFCLEFKESIEKRFQRYVQIETNSYKIGRTTDLVMEVSKCCKEIAACDRILDGKRGAIYAQQLTPLLAELDRLGFFEKT